MVDSFAAYAYTVVNKRVDNRLENYPGETPIVFSLKTITFNVSVKSKESIKNSISFLVYLLWRYFSSVVVVEVAIRMWQAREVGKME